MAQRPSKRNPPSEVAQTVREIRTFFKREDSQGRRIGRAPGIYAFYDYDGEPIYVGQTVTSLSDRVGRHLTGRRSDAVGSSCSTPFEVLEMEVWPLWDLWPAKPPSVKKRKAKLSPYEYTVYSRLLKRSHFRAVLNEDPIRKTQAVTLPKSYRGRIVPDDLYEERRHPDVRLARRAQTVASLARLISERRVGPKLRTVLDVQTRRLAWLSTTRLKDFTEAK